MTNPAIGLIGLHRTLPTYIKGFRIEDSIGYTYWTKRPTGGQTTLNDLINALEINGFFYFYYGYDNRVKCRLRVVDFAWFDTEKEIWTRSGKEKQFWISGVLYNLNEYEDNAPSIFFLFEEFVESVWHTSEHVDYTTYFEYGNSSQNYSAPTQDNLQPVRNNLNINLNNISVYSSKR